MVDIKAGSDGSAFTNSKLYSCIMQVKPAVAGSSIGVAVAYGVTDSLKKANDIILEVIWFHTVCYHVFCFSKLATF